MGKFSSKIAFSIITAGLFIVVAFAAINYENLNSSFFIVAGTVVVFIFLFGFAMGNNYAAPVKELLKKANITSNGNLKVKPDVQTKDEIEEISKAFTKITEGLSQITEDAETLKKSSDIKLKTKDLISEKVMDALEEKVKNRTSELERVLVEVDGLRRQLAEKDRQIQDLSKPSQTKRKK